MIKYRKQIIFLAIIFILLPFLVGCSAAVQDTPLPLNTDTKTTAYPLIVRDHSGAEIIILNKPKRIISLLPSSTEILFALGQENNLIAVTKYDNYPADIQDRGYYLFEDALNPNPDKILELQPDLVIIGSVSGETLRKLRNLDIPVISFNPQSIEETYDTIRSIGYITDSSKKAALILEKMISKENEIKQIVATIEEHNKPRVWLEASADLYTAGKNTFMNELITKAGGINITSDLEGWGRYKSEDIIAKNPQVILVTYGQFVENVRQEIKNRPGWQEIDAVKNDRIIELDYDLVMKPGPRIINGLELIAKSLFPEKFKLK
ncbi:MAG TPA: ABC transporter substrate-binding protein [Peptococcaceae bacterium]|nr:ABC transporter substrate-binding protein [Peptococcaceae bacterium]